MSLVALFVLLICILMLWFPGILFSADGGWAGLRIVIGVDLVVGPLMTLIVFKSGKPGLKFDLTCIAIAQITMMAVGSWIIYQERPLALILAYDTFYSVSKKEFEDYGKDAAILNDFPGRSPKLIYVEMPESDTGADIANMRGFFIGDPLFMQTDKYRAIPANLADATSVFRRENLARASVTEDLLTTLNANCLFSKFISSVTSGYVCFDRETRKPSNYYGAEYAKAESL